MWPIQVKVPVGWSQVLPPGDRQRKALASLLKEVLHLAQKLSQMLAPQFPPRLQIEVSGENVDPVALAIFLNDGRIETVLVPEFSRKHVGASAKVQSVGRGFGQHIPQHLKAILAYFLVGVAQDHPSVAVLLTDPSQGTEGSPRKSDSDKDREYPEAGREDLQADLHLEKADRGRPVRRLRGLPGRNHPGSERLLQPDAPRTPTSPGPLRDCLVAGDSAAQ